MKSLLRVSLVVLVLAFVVGSVLAQVPQTKEDWEKAMQETAQKVATLKTKAAAVQAEIDKLKQADAAKAAELKKCEEDLAASLGTEQETAEFNQLLDKIDASLNELSKLSNKELWERKAELDSVQALLDKAKASKAAYLPKNENRLKNQQERLNALKASLKKPEDEVKTYTVGTWSRDRDCLWNIAKKPAIYENPFLWPKIWQGNKDQIKNPDVIKKGQILKIPPKAPLTKEEKSAVNSYWRKKNAAAKPAAPAKP